MKIDNKRTGLKATLLEQFPESGEVPPGGIYAKMEGFIGIACPGCGQCSAMRVGNPKPAENPSWKTTGSKYDLTSFSLSPSIHCTGCCGWHGYLTNGVFESC